MDDEVQFQRWIDGLRRGDSQCGREFFDRYGSVLGRIAGKHLASWLHRRVDPDDVVQSVCRTFLGHLQKGDYQLSDGQCLFSLLCAITLNKVLKTARFHRAGKRDHRREVAAAPPSAGESGDGFEAADPEPSPAEAAEFAEEFQRLMASLGEEERRILELKLEGRKTQEIAESLRRTERWVRKVLERLRQRVGSARESLGD